MIYFIVLQNLEEIKKKIPLNNQTSYILYGLVNDKIKSDHFVEHSISYIIYETRYFF